MATNAGSNKEPTPNEPPKSETVPVISLLAATEADIEAITASGKLAREER